MADPAVVLILILAGGAGERPAPDVAAAAREALGEDVRVLVESRSETPTDEEARRMGEQVHAAAVAELRWDEEEQRRAYVHLYLGDERRWYDRDLEFRAGDDARERARAVGYLIGAMVRVSLAAQEAPSTPPPQPSPPSVPAPPAAEDRPVDRSPRPARFAFDAAADAWTGIGSDARGLGPAMRGHFFFSEHVGLTLGGGVRFGDVGAVDASARVIRLGGGVAARAVFAERWETIILVEPVAFHHSVVRETPRATRDRWLFGGRLGTSLCLRLGPVDPFVGLAIEATAGETAIVFGAERVGEIPAFRAAAEVGVRGRF